jgi:hypothetical protein
MHQNQLISGTHKVSYFFYATTKIPWLCFSIRFELASSYGFHDYRVLKQTNITKQMPKIRSVQQFTVWSKILSPHLLLIYTLVLLSLVDMLQSYHVISKCLIYNICSLHHMAEIRLTLALNTNKSINVSCCAWHNPLFKQI